MQQKLPNTTGFTHALPSTQDTPPSSQAPPQQYSLISTGHQVSP